MDQIQLPGTSTGVFQQVHFALQKENDMVKREKC